MFPDLELKRIVAASAVVKRELSQRKARLSVYQPIYVPTLTSVHKMWELNVRMILRIKAAEMSISLRDGVRGSVIQERIRIDLLLFHIRCSRYVFQVWGRPGTDPGR